MSLEQKINDGIKAAMLAKDKIRLESLRAVKAAILLVKTSENAKDFNEAAEIKILQKLVKQRHEAAEIYVSNKRSELAEKELAEAVIIEEFLPKQLSLPEIESAIKSIIATTGASCIKDMGKVMAAASAQLAGKADGKIIADTVKKLLQ
ncbi:MAG: GatB/YqeY domain-containing protein [Prevotellaceae bacterium]|jgi:uncharacterized protein YqeY|nr:GatB/YqeY domain-containing protein [Prevotellaceae bacterium]